MLPILRSETVRYAPAMSEWTGLPWFHMNCPGCGINGAVVVPARALCIDCIESRVFADTPERGFWLYRLWRDRRLVYVGVTRNPRRRLREHWNRWFGVFDNVSWEECADEFDMLSREAHAIAMEYPAFNVDHPEAR